LSEQGFRVVALAATLTLFGCAGGAPLEAASPTPAVSTAGERSRNEPGVAMAPGSAPAVAAGADAPPDLAATRVAPDRVPVPSADAPSRGPADAPVTIQIFSDFECPYCALAAPVVRELEGEFGGRIRIVWRNLPLAMHPHAALAAVTALEVYSERGGAAFWRFHDAVFAAQRSGLSEQVLEHLAQAEGVDLTRYHAAIASHLHDARIRADLEAGDAAGVNGTPAFFVNSYFAMGALPYPEMRAVVVQALKEAGLSATVNAR
jgi:protein-disulfide isomerase